MSLILHTIYAVGYGTTYAGGVTRQDAPFNIDVRGEPTDGQPYASTLHVYARRPEASWVTRAIGEHLDLCGPSGKAISDLAGGFKLYGQAKAEEGIRATTGALALTYLAGLIVPTSLTVSHNTDAELTYSLHAQLENGNGNSNNLCAISAVSPLPTIADGTARYGLGPCECGGFSFEQVTQVQVGFGLQVQAESADGEADPQHVSIISVVPTIRIRGTKLATYGAAAIPFDGLQGTHGSLSFYLRKREDSGQYVLDATAEHIKITAAGLAYMDNAFSGSGNASGESSVVIATKYDGTNFPLLVTVDTAIV